MYCGPVTHLLLLLPASLHIYSQLETSRKTHTFNNEKKKRIKNKINIALQ